MYTYEDVDIRYRDKLHNKLYMKLALQIYGQLRTFKECMPSILNFINYYNEDFDVFLFIDDSHSKDYITMNSNTNYSEENIQMLEDLLLKSRIKRILYVRDMKTDDIVFEDCMVQHYLNIHNKFTSKHGNVDMNIFAPRLMYRKYLLNEIRKEFEIQNNITYKYVIRTRFDIKTSLPVHVRFDYKHENTPVLCSDVLTISSPEFINIESLCGIAYPVTPTLCFDNNCDLIKEKYEKYKNWRGDKFWDRNWIFMPELNLRLFLLENGCSFIEAWWMPDRNYGFKIIR